MKLFIGSDFHLESFPSHKYIISWLEKVISVCDIDKDKDILILAGDINVGFKFETHFFIKRFINKYFNNVLYIPGNHEYYHSTISLTDVELSEIWKDQYYPMWIKEINNQRFIMCTLWFEDHPCNVIYKKLINDFEQINFNNNGNLFYSLNKFHKNFLEDNLQKDDVLITHYLPLKSSVAEKYKSSVLNSFFVSDISELILEREPKLVIHGHTHEKMDYILNNIRVVCNPFGYLFDSSTDIKNYELKMVEL